jgi:hypothetical protein
VLKDYADLLNLDLHGPATELSKLNEPLAQHHDRTVFELQTGGFSGRKA